MPVLSTGFNRAMQRSQRGVTTVIVAIALLALLGISGLALDMGHAFVNNTRLQNAVDAGALSGAKVLSQTGDQTAATDAARATFSENATDHGNDELAVIPDSDVIVEFSDQLIPFTPGGTDPEYVRVRVNNFTLESFLIQVLGFADKPVAASAVAGPSPQLAEACDLIPVMVCGDPDADPPLYGYTAGQDVVLKSPAPGAEEIGPGNFQLIALGGTGGNVVRQNMAGGYDDCLIAGEPVLTEPGNEVGPVAQGLNTRFGDYQGGMSPDEYPPDLVTDAGGAGYPDTYTDYTADYAIPDYDEPSIGEAERRVVSLPIVDCSEAALGRTDMPYLDLACFFLREPATHSGSTQEIHGEFLDGGCATGGVPGPDPGTGIGPFIIQLYENSDSLDS